MFSLFKIKKTNLKLFFLYEFLPNEGKSCILRAIHLVDMEKEKTVKSFKLPTVLEDQIHDTDAVIKWESIIDSIWKNKLTVPSTLKVTPQFNEYYNFLKNIYSKFGKNVDQIVCEVV
jgi:hypothetical protein